MRSYWRAFCATMGCFYAAIAFSYLRDGSRWWALLWCLFASFWIFLAMHEHERLTRERNRFRRQ